MLHYYGQDTHYETVKEWYDGYRFGNADVYCPWDVINYCDAHRRNPMLPPENYWTNTSGNDVLKHFIESAGATKGLAKTDLERLVNGEIVEKDIREDLTYNELYASMVTFGVHFSWRDILHIKAELIQKDSDLQCQTEKSGTLSRSRFWLCLSRMWKKTDSF